MENIGITGFLTIELRKENGTSEIYEFKNRIMQLGLARIAQRLAGSANAMTHMAIGSNSANDNNTRTALGTELGRVTLTSATVTTQTTTNDSVTYIAAFAAGVGTGAITEAGIFDAASAGTMLSRSIFTVINKGVSDSLTITWKVVMAGS
jgi:hypothetical protein